ncbi:uncharacterized protein LOC117648142 [Thrips palmi]|uniref:Uncharacterized protein LOC117648142 n=1 Tax=Thrips palmi TaxID=161013 RepID=A0A6P8Z7Y8_THRPL|nr:uncharacterized protein LOC117648142 [Thrips palmi]
MDHQEFHFGPIIKEEPPVELIFDDDNTMKSVKQLNLDESPVPCPEHYTKGLSTNVKIEEMNMRDFKVEEDFDTKFFFNHVEKEAQQLSQLAKGIQRRNRKIIHYRKLFQIARDYAALYTDEVRHPCPFPRFRGSTIIQCPACMIPRNHCSRSEFLDLLHHVQKRHPTSSSLLFGEISKTYGPLIESMKRKISSRSRKKYPIRLRAEVH